METIDFDTFALMLITAASTAAVFGGFIVYIMQDRDDD